MLPQKAFQCLPHFVTRYDGVYEAMFQQKFRALEIFRQLLFCRLLNNTPPCKANGGPWFGKDNIPKHGEACCNTAGRRVCQHCDRE